MSMTKPEALAQIEITVLRQIGDNIAAQTKRVEALTDKVDDVRERVIRLEAQEAGKLVESLRGDLAKALARIDQLESQRDRALGARDLWTWVVKNTPGLVAILAAFAAGVGLKFVEK